MAPKKEPEPEPEPAEEPQEPQEGSGAFVFGDGSKYGARQCQTAIRSDKFPTAAFAYF